MAEHGHVADKRNHADLLAVLEHESRITHDNRAITGSQVLARAYAAIRREKDWCKYACLSMRGPSAQRCSMGAIGRAAGIEDDQSDILGNSHAQNALRLLMVGIMETDVHWESHVGHRASMVPGYFVTTWNDNPQVSHRMVLCAFRCAIDIAKREERRDRHT